MKTKIIAIVTASAIATAGISAPARADSNEDFARFLLGAAFIGILANAANNNTKVTVKPRPHRPVVHVVKPTHVHAQKPRQCVRRQHTRQGWVTYFGARCMNQLGWHKERGQWVRDRHAHR